MNIVQLQDQLKNFSQDQLIREMQAPSGNAPQFLVLSEIMRRQRMQQDMMAQQAKGQPQSTVAEDAVAAAAIPQAGLASMAKSIAPNTDMDKSTGVKAMASGGPVRKMAEGGSAMVDPAIIAMANRMGMTVQQYLRSLDQDEAARLEESARRRQLRDRMVAMEPAGDGVSFPSQLDLDRRYSESLAPLAPSRPMTYATSSGLGALIPKADRPPQMQPTASLAVPRADAAPIRDMLSERQIAAMQAAQPSFPPPDAGLSALGPDFERRGRQGGVNPILAAELNLRQQLQDQGFETGEIDMAEEARRSAEEAAAARGAAGIDRSLRTPDEVKAVSEAARARVSGDGPPAQPTGIAAAAASGSVSGTVGTSGGSAGIAAAAAPTDYEQALMDTLARREKAAEQDKWLALAQVGLNLMSSNNPTFMGALGEAGLKGVEAARTARDQYDKDKLEILGALEQYRMARLKAAGSGGSGGGGGGGAGASGDYFSLSAGQNRYIQRLDDEIERLTNFVSDPILSNAVASNSATNEQALAYSNAQALLNERISMRNAILGLGGETSYGNETTIDLEEEE